jgi:hypothetical protein
VAVCQLHECTPVPTLTPLHLAHPHPHPWGAPPTPPRLNEQGSPILAAGSTDGVVKLWEVGTEQDAPDPREIAGFCALPDISMDDAGSGLVMQVRLGEEGGAVFSSSFKLPSLDAHYSPNLHPNLHPHLHPHPSPTANHASREHYTQQRQHPQAHTPPTKTTHTPIQAPTYPHTPHPISLATQRKRQLDTVL